MPLLEAQAFYLLNTKSIGFSQPIDIFGCDTWMVNHLSGATRARSRPADYSILHSERFSTPKLVPTLD